jgi:hypothetical protein
MSVDLLTLSPFIKLSLCCCAVCLVAQDAIKHIPSIINPNIFIGAKIQITIDYSIEKER